MAPSGQMAIKINIELEPWAKRGDGDPNDDRELKYVANKSHAIEMSIEFY